MQRETDKSLSAQLAELEDKFNNESLGTYEREHAFCGYWLARLQIERGLSRDSISRLLSYTDWWPVIAEVIGQLCRTDVLSNDDLDWLLETVPKTIPQSRFSLEQLKALKCLRDQELGWQDKLPALLELKADWAVHRIIRSIPLDQIDTARHMIEGSKRPRRARNELLAALQSKIKS